jgi:uncharacterized protein (DUF924 family)
MKAFDTLRPRRLDNDRHDAPEDVVAFWRASSDRWFDKDAAFDAAFRKRFLDLHMAVAARWHERWMETPDGALALLILTDQFPRNAFRGTAHMFATDPLARNYAYQAIESGHMECVEPDLRLFFCLPFAHAEDMSDQDLAVRLNVSPPVRPSSASIPGAEALARKPATWGRWPSAGRELPRAAISGDAEVIRTFGEVPDDLQERRPLTSDLFATLSDRAFPPRTVAFLLSLSFDDQIQYYRLQGETCYARKAYRHSRTCYSCWSGHMGWKCACRDIDHDCLHIAGRVSNRRTR